MDARFVALLSVNLAVLNVHHHQAPCVQLPRVGRAIGQPALGDGDQALHERPQFLGLRHRRLQVFVTQQSGRLIAEHRDAMRRHAAQLAMFDSVSHGVILKG